jgi:hypothetical protein
MKKIVWAVLLSLGLAVGFSVADATLAPAFAGGKPDSGTKP